MHIIQGTPKEAITQVVGDLAESLQKGKVLWLVCGGSNVPYIVAILNQVRNSVSQEMLKNLTLGLTDEKFTATDTQGANWKQLIDGGLDVSGITTAEVFTGKTLEETVAEYEELVEGALRARASVIAHIGIAQDGHCAGVLPHSLAVNADATVVTYEAPPHTRVTLSLAGLCKMSRVHAFVFGESKCSVIHHLKNGKILFEEMPSQALKHIHEAYVYTDQAHLQNNVTKGENSEL